MAEKISMSYHELLESVSKFNSRLLAARRARIPYFISSTGLIYGDGRQPYQAKERYPGHAPGQLYVYPTRPWKIKTRPPPAPVERCVTPAAGTENAPAGSMAEGQSFASTTTEPSITQVPTSYLDRALQNPAAELFEDAIAGSITRNTWMPAPLEIPHESVAVSSKEHKEKEIADSDDDEEEEYMPRSGRKKEATKPISKAGRARKNVDYTVHAGAEKPFSCNYCDMCYKTRPGLTYHVSKEHPNGAASPSKSSSNNSATSVPFPRPLMPPSLPLPTSTGRESRDREGRLLLCDVCEVENATGRPGPKSEKLITCASCGHSAHPTCLNFSRNQRESTSRYPWRCIECKTCSLCNQAGNDEKLLFCDDCDRGYHMYCLRPPLDDTPDGPWSCDGCLQQYGEEAAHMVWKRNVQQEAVAKYQREREEEVRRGAASSNLTSRYSNQTW